MKVELCQETSPACWKVAPGVAEANWRLRRALAGGQWAIALPNDRILRRGMCCKKTARLCRAALSAKAPYQVVRHPAAAAGH